MLAHGCDLPSCRGEYWRNNVQSSSAESLARKDFRLTTFFDRAALASHRNRWKSSVKRGVNGLQ
jgi:hypothetical protein